MYNSVLSRVKNKRGGTGGTCGVFMKLTFGCERVEVVLALQSVIPGRSSSHKSGVSRGKFSSMCFLRLDCRVTSTLSGDIKRFLEKADFIRSGPIRRLIEVDTKAYIGLSKSKTPMPTNAHLLPRCISLCRYSA